MTTQENIVTRKTLWGWIPVKSNNGHRYNERFAFSGIQELAVHVARLDIAKSFSIENAALQADIAYLEIQRLADRNIDGGVRRTFRLVVSSKGEHPHLTASHARDTICTTERIAEMPLLGYCIH